MEKVDKKPTEATQYTEYLALDVLLNAQHPKSDNPDELHFILIHQIHELWFKLALHHMERLRDALDADDLIEAVRLTNQITAVFESATQTVEHLHSLPPVAFHAYRQLLAPGSGMQSRQFREFEVLAGLRDKGYVKWILDMLAAEPDREAIRQRLAEPSLREAFTGMLDRRDAGDLADVYANPSRDSALYGLCDALSILEHTVLRWRYSHIQLVERTIGAGVVGTGGTTHDYLVASLKRRFFPALWEARNVLTTRVNDGTLNL